MPPSTSAPLTAEPTQPEEREKQNLPPKSYAHAVEVESSFNNTHGPSDLKSSNDANISKSANGAGDGQSNGSTHQASVLKIVDTGAPEAKKKPETRPQVENQDSQQEYSATGTDDTPRTPSRQKHRKSGSKSTKESGETPKEPETDAKAGGQQGHVKDDQENTTVFEGEHNGSRLISVKPASKFESELQKGQKKPQKLKREETLASGRKAGQRWERSAIRWAPMNVPLQRRLQTLMVLWHTLSIAIGVSTFFFLCAIPLFWPLLIPYMIYCMSSKASMSGTLSHRSEMMRRSPLWSLFASYFPARLHRTQELPATRKYIFGYHPHGIISHGAFAAFSTEALGFAQLFPGIKNTLLTLDSNFRIPIYRDYALGMGLASVAKESCENLLSKGGPNGEGMGRAITIVVGGARESLDAQPYSLRLVLKRRKGFVKMAIRTGADLVPVLAFGENDLYDQFDAESHPRIHKFQLLVKKLMGFTIPLFHARGVFNYDVGLLPYRRPLNIVVGRPVKVTQSSKPEQDEIDRVHEEYVQELERLWDLWKDDFSPNRQEDLQILE